MVQFCRFSFDRFGPFLVLHCDLLCLNWLVLWSKFSKRMNGEERQTIEGSLHLKMILLPRYWISLYKRGSRRKIKEKYQSTKKNFSKVKNIFPNSFFLIRKKPHGSKFYWSREVQHQKKEDGSNMKEQNEQEDGRMLLIVRRDFLLEYD